MLGVSRPVNDNHDTFPDHANGEIPTFVGRPFPLEEAHEHLARLRRWGLTFSESSFLLSLRHSSSKFYSKIHSNMGSDRTCRTVRSILPLLFIQLIPTTVVNPTDLTSLTST